MCLEVYLAAKTCISSHHFNYILDQIHYQIKVLRTIQHHEHIEGNVQRSLLDIVNTFLLERISRLEPVQAKLANVYKNLPL